MSEVIVRSALDTDLLYLSRRGRLSGENLLQKIRRKEIFLLVVDDQPAGLLTLEFLWSLVPYIALIWIDESFRRMGYSRELLGFAEERLRGEGHRQLYSSSQADEDQPQAWHRHMGFEECGVINGINEGGIGEIFFRKTL